MEIKPTEIPDKVGERKREREESVTDKFMKQERQRTKTSKTNLHKKDEIRDRKTFRANINKNN